MNTAGFDLGTTNSAVAILKGRPVIVEDFMGNRTVPSAVGWDSDLNELVFGLDAKESPELYGTVLSVKRKMGSDERIQVGPHSWRPQDVSAEILKLLKRQVEERTGQSVTEAVITVPAYFQMSQMAATKEAGELAGLKVQQLLAEPSAAIMAYGPQKDQKILVYDLGGGTFDVAIVDFFAGILTTLAVFGNNFLGGDDFDRRIMNHLVELLKKKEGVAIDLDNDIYAWSKLKGAAERAKIEMSRKRQAPISIPKVTEVNGRPVGIETSIKTDDFHAMIRDLVTGTLTEIEKALNHAKLDTKDIDTVLLVGGSTYIPLVQQTVREFFGKDPNRTINPDLAVALGAAASVMIGEPTGHVVTVDFIPEATPEKEIELAGRTSANSQVHISGAAETVNLTADEQGYFTACVPLNPGVNTLKLVAVAPDGRRATIEPEPVVYDPNAEVQEPPPAPSPPRLTRALSFSCVLDLGAKRIVEDSTAVILNAQSELPASVSSSQFSTMCDGQRKLKGELLEGDLPLAGINTKLAEIEIDLPPNVPAGEEVTVHYHVDENFALTAEVEVRRVNAYGKVTVNLRSPTSQVHIFQQIEGLFTEFGDRIRPEERAALEQSRVTIEDISNEIARLKSAQTDADAIWNAYSRLRLESQQLTQKIRAARGKYG